VKTGREAGACFPAFGFCGISVGDIKSAWELAMEKVERLGKLSTEELRKQKEEKYGSIGQILADKYLGGLALWQLRIEVDKYSAEEKDLVEQVMTARLIHSIELGSYESLLRVVQVVLSLDPIDSAVRGIEKKIEQLFDQYKGEEEKESQRMEKSAGEVLRQLGISGSAIGALDPKVVSQCQETLARLAQPYRERLEVLKEGLIDLIKSRWR